MAGVITLKFSVLKQNSDLGVVVGPTTSTGTNNTKEKGLKSPIFLPGPVEPQFGPGRYLTFEGFSVDHEGRQHYLDTTVAYRETCRRVIEYLRRYGYNDYQIYLLLSCAPVQGHIAGLVDIPNACTTLGVPVDIFDFDIGPESPVIKRDMGSCAFTTDLKG